MTSHENLAFPQPPLHDKHVCLPCSESRLSLHKLIYACARDRVCLRKHKNPKQDRIWTGSCLRWSMVLRKVWRGTSKWIRLLSLSFPPEFLPLCVFVVGKFIWVSVRLVKHGHNRLILLWHIQQRAFLCVCHTLRKTHANKHCDDLTTHAQTFVFHISVI